MTGQKDDYSLPPFSLKAIIAEYCANEQAAALALIPSVEAERLGVCPLSDLLAAAKCIELLPDAADTETSQRREWKASDVMPEAPRASTIPTPSRRERVYVPRASERKEAKKSVPSTRLLEYSCPYSSLSVSQRPGRLLARRDRVDRVDALGKSHGRTRAPVASAYPTQKGYTQTPGSLRNREDQLSASLKMRSAVTFATQRSSGGMPPGQLSVSQASRGPINRPAVHPWKTLGYPVRTTSPDRYPYSKLISASVAAPTAFSMASRASSPAQSMVPQPGVVATPMQGVPRTFSRQASMDRSQPLVTFGRERSDVSTFNSPVMLRDQRGMICQAWTTPVVASQAQIPAHRIVGYPAYRVTMAPTAPMSAAMRQSQGQVIYGTRPASQGYGYTTSV